MIKLCFSAIRVLLSILALITLPRSIFSVPFTITANDKKKFELFYERFSLGGLTTEQRHPRTKNLSETMNYSLQEGLRLLCMIDRQVMRDIKPTMYRYSKNLAPTMVEKIKKGGRIFLAGAGSSGRVAIDLAAKWRKNCQKHPDAVVGLIAGGDSAFVRAKEGYEDSERAGKNVLRKYELNENDTVFLLSASGSPFFNRGAALAASFSGSTVYYFYNSKKVPARTQELFDHYRVVPLLVDIGPQVITGSTRLQAASVAEIILGSLLHTTSSSLNYSVVCKKRIVSELQDGITNAFKNIDQKLPKIAQIARAGAAVLSDQMANFRRLRDENEQGYITFLLGHDCPEVIIDSVEIPPTFSTSRPKKTSERGKKRAEFRAFVTGAYSNGRAWELVLGRKPVDIEETQQLLLAQQADGVGSYAQRPTNKGNLVIGVIKDLHDEKVYHSLFTSLQDARRSGACTALLIVSNNVKNSEKKLQNMRAVTDTTVVINNLTADQFGLVSTLTLKCVLNMISNSIMIMMHKVDGNQMIDVDASNNKLKDRAIRLVLDTFNRYTGACPFDYETVYHYVNFVHQRKKSYVESREVYTPSIVKIVVTMLKKGVDFDSAVALLRESNESLKLVMTDQSTIEN